MRATDQAGVVCAEMDGHQISILRSMAKEQGVTVGEVARILLSKALEWEERVPLPPTPPAERKVVDLMDALERSLKDARKARVEREATDD